MAFLKHTKAEQFLTEIKSEYIDLTVTSPPYDDLRKYNNSFDLELICKELYRATKKGGVCVWVVGDKTVNGSETGTSFKHALKFMECGWNLHDTMIWEKTGRLPTQDRYYNIFEYMFVFSKGKPKTMNFICDHKTVNGGRKQQKDAVINKGENKKGEGYFIRNELSRRGNIWKIHIGRNLTEHPAVFPKELPNDHILTWSNKGDVVCDFFLGSGTTLISAIENERDYIGCEIDAEYFKIAETQIQTVLKKPSAVGLLF
jgi:site-specific DNA-methyltransferase (adenine-specific)